MLNACDIIIVFSTTAKNPFQQEIWITSSSLFVSWGQLESLNLDMFFLPLFKIITYHAMLKVFEVTIFLSLLFERCAEIISNVSLVRNKVSLKQNLVYICTLSDLANQKKNKALVKLVKTNRRLSKGLIFLQIFHSQGLLVHVNACINRPKR